MEFSIQPHTIISGWSIVYIEGPQNIISIKNIVGRFVLANSVDPDEMPHDAAFHLGLHRLSKYPFRGFRFTKG